MNKIKFSNDLDDIPKKDIQEAVKIAESYFHTEQDQNQLRINEANFIWTIKNFPKCLNIIKDKENVIGVTLILPCKKEYMKEFLSKKINEYELFDKIKKNVNYDNFETIYLCLAYVKPEYRKKGLALKSFVDSVIKLSKMRSKKVDLFYWAFSQEGKKLINKVGKELDLKVLGI